jgi:sarcosine oxidase
VTQEQVFHFPPRDGTLWPSLIHHGEPFVYGLETLGEGVKVAEHHTGKPLGHPDDRDFQVDPAGRERVVEFVRQRLPGLVPVPATETTCLYTTTSDESFVLERRGRVVVGSACSGHGFKFTPAIGQRLAALALDCLQ